jgi:hypothetical protein
VSYDSFGEFLEYGFAIAENRYMNSEDACLKCKSLALKAKGIRF